MKTFIDLFSFVRAERSWNMSREKLVIAAGLACAVAFAPSASAQMVRKVLIVGVDGMRPDAMLAANCPNFDSLIATGAFSSQCLAEDITISGPCWSSILCGVHRGKHGVNDNSFTAPNYGTYPHFFRRLQESCDASTASIANWAPINTQITLNNADVTQTGLSDANVALACVALLEQGDPDVIFLHFDEVDGSGHTHGFSPTIPAYLATIETTDTRVGQVLTAIEARPTYANEDWLIIVTSDHGGTPDRTHGRNIPEHRLTGLIVSGLSSAFGTTITPAPELVDVPATVMTFLGIPIQASWGWDGEAVGLNMANSPSMPFECVAPPPPRVGACCLQSGLCVVLEEAPCIESRGNWAGEGTTCQTVSCTLPRVIFTEQFESVVLGPNVDETTAGTNVWSPLPPAGWSIDRSGVPSGGVTEWRGWSIASRTWWSQAAQDQGRSQFLKGAGAVAIADPDEWNDLANGNGLYSSVLTTPAISLSGIQPGTSRLFFDSSWRPEALQAALITVRYDGGPAITVAEWTSVAGANFKPDATNETLAFWLNTPPGAQSMTLSFKLFDADNNWWWAIDNVQVVGSPTIARRVLLDENFESVPLGPNVNESLAADRVWSGMPPAGWVFDDSGVPAVNDPTRGVTEWEGWAITDRVWWTQAAGDQRRSEFTRGVGAVAVADPDEWDDIGSPNTIGPYNAVMRSLTVPISLVDPTSFQLGLDSSWRPEGLQQARIVAHFDVGAPVTLLQWDSSAGPTFKPDATNERIELSFSAPPQATTLRLDFSLLNARNNWWWAVDNVRLTGLDTLCPADLNQDGGVDGDDVIWFFSRWDQGLIAADFNGDGGVDGDDVIEFFGRWDQGC